jgi:O-antigen ligase/polysaccharide polymerase Wzy-like membrane protein
MRVIVGDSERGPIVSAALIVGALGILALNVALDASVKKVAPLMAGIVIAALFWRVLLTWRALIAATTIVVLFVPLERYTLPVNLPLQLELYRVFAGFVIASWMASLLIDQRVRLRPSGLELPISAVLAATIGSVLANPGRISALGVENDVVKGVMFLTTFFLVFYVIVSVIRTFADLDFLIKALVAGGSLVAGLTLIEARTGFNAFNHINKLLPFLEPINQEFTVGTKIVGSSASHIELGALLVMLVPLGSYVARKTSRARWWAATGALGIGALASLSRTSVVMLLVVGFVFALLRPHAVKRLAPALIPALIAVHLLAPGTLGDLKQMFFPRGGLIAEQSQHPGWRGSGRLADLPGAMDEFSRQPLLGQGYSTRQTGRENIKAATANILDDQWLKTLLETGLAGFAAWIWLFIRLIRRLATEAKHHQDDCGWLLVSLTASISSFCVGMFLFDAFSFIQVTFILFLMMGFGAAVTAPAFERTSEALRRRSVSRPLLLQHGANTYSRG